MQRRGVWKPEHKTLEFRQLHPQHNPMRLPELMTSTLLSALALGWSAPALAQGSYACRLPNGNYVQSDRPCSSSTGLTYYPPISTPTPAPSYIPKAGLPPDHLQYMSPRCSAMNDAIRTSGVRGLSYQANAELQRNYQRECSEDESDARNRLYKERGDVRKAETEAKRSAQAAEQQSQMAQQQCDESKRIIASKKRRTDLNEGERNELLRFEANIRARCS